MNLIKTIFATIISLLTIVTSSADDGCQLHFRNINGEISDATIRTFAEDSDGYMWLGSDNKIFRYDGINIISYPLPTSSPDKIVLVNDIIETTKDEIILATTSGLFSLHKNNSGISTISPLFQEKIFSATGLVKLSDGSILISSNSGLWLYKSKGGGISKITIEGNPLSDTDAHAAIANYGQNALVMTSKGQIFKLNSQRKLSPVKFNCDKKLIPNKIIEVYGNIYIATEKNGLWKVDLKTSKVEHISDVQSNVVTSMATSGLSKLYVGTDGMGIYVLDAKTGSLLYRISSKNAAVENIQSNQIYALTTDTHGNLWVGHYQRGADYSLSTDGSFSLLSFNNNGESGIRTIDILPQKRIIVGTRDGIQILPFEANEVLTTIKRPSLRSNLVISTCILENILYIGTYGGGLSAYDLISEEFISSPDILPKNTNSSHIFSIYEDKNTHSLWFGTSDGLFKHDKDGLTLYTSENSPLPKGNVYLVYFDSSHKGWIATEEGLALYEPENQRIRIDCFPKDFIAKAKVRQIYEGSDQTLYFVLDNGGFFISDLSMTEFSRPEIFSKRNIGVKAVIEDDYNYIWLTTNQGLFRWNRIKSLFSFGGDNRCAATPFLQCIPAKTGNRLLFGNTAGLFTVNTEINNENLLISHLMPTSVECDGNISFDNIIKDKGSKNEYTVKLNKNYDLITVKFSPLSYSLPDSKKYEYSLDGSEWIPLPQDYSITAHHLTTGTTKFIVRITDAPESEVVVKISKPSLNLWVIALISLVVICLAIYVIKSYRNRRQTESDDNETETEAIASSENGVQSKPKTKYATIGMSKKECYKLTTEINRILEKDKPYVNPDLKIGDLATMADISSHKLSYLLSQHLKVGFYDYINGFRIKEFKRLVDNGDYKNLTLTAMSEKAGFSSRSSFFRCFKKLEGITPGEYLKNKGIE